MQLFVSYKSEDANFVREVVERLLARGVNLWLNEYQVLVENYEHWQKAINKGLDQATHGLVFSNKRWAESKHCCDEMKGLLERIHDPENIIEVCIPREDEPLRKYYPQAEPIVFQGNHRKPTGDEVQDVVADICARLRLPGSGERLASSPGESLCFERYGIEFDPGPLRPALTHTQLAELINSHYLRSVTLTGKIAAIDVILDIIISPFDSILRRLSISQDGAADDRKVWKAYWKYARQWLKEESKRRDCELYSRGLHLVFIGGNSHFGLTYISKKLSACDSLWERRYVITLRDLGTDLLGEMSLIFTVRLEGTEPHQFEQFCRLGPQLDCIARSLKIRRPAVSKQILDSLPLFVGRGFYAAGSIASLSYFVTTSKPDLVLLALATASGYFCADLLLMAFRPLYRRLVQTLRPLSDELEGPSLFERTSNDLFHQLTSIPGFLITDLLFGIRGLCKKPLQILTVTALSTLAWAAWWWLCRSRELPLWTVFIPFGGLLGALLKVSAVNDWISKKRTER